MKPLGLIMRDIKVEHTLFAMPFAVMGAFLAAGGMPDTKVLGLMLLAMIFARSAAMAFNRLADARFDATNPRTKGRPLASGAAGTASYVVFVAASSAAFVAVCAFINPLAFHLSPLALAVVFFYSFTKRFTAFSHFFLGIALALAPVGAWVAVRAEAGLPAFLLAGAVVFWLVGLDIIYSCQDVEHDRAAGLYSIPSRFGVAAALKISAAAHFVMAGLLAAVYFSVPALGAAYPAGVALAAALLWYEHSLVSPGDLRRVNTAFFNVNGVISVGLMVFTLAAVFWR